jgi:putative SOS response-associated peptidase YedK
LERDTACLDSHIRLRSNHGSGNRFRQQYPFWAKEPSIGLRTINAKAETITTTAAFREAIKYRAASCLPTRSTNGKS